MFTKEQAEQIISDWYDVDRQLESDGVDSFTFISEDSESHFIYRGIERGNAMFGLVTDTDEDTTELSELIYIDLGNNAWVQVELYQLENEVENEDDEYFAAQYSWQGQ
jgi:hypothetical protein